MEIAQQIQSWAGWLADHPGELRRCSDELEQRIGPQNRRAGAKSYDWQAASRPADPANWLVPTRGLSPECLAEIGRLRDFARRAQVDYMSEDPAEIVGTLIAVAIETAEHTRYQPTAKEGPARAYTLQEAAERIGVSDRHLRKFIHDGKLKSFKVGVSRRISHDALQDFIQQQEGSQS